MIDSPNAARSGDCVLVFDIGTTGLKCALFDSGCAEMAAATESYATRYPRPGWAEQDARDYWRAAVAACRRLLAESRVEPARVAAIGLSGHMNGCLPVDSSGEPLCPEIIHSDGRGTAQREAVLSRIGEREFYAIAGNRVDVHFSLPKMLWIRDELPSIYGRAAFFLNSKDYLRSILVGRTGLTDLSDASLTACLDIGRRAWSRELASELGYDLDKLPELRAGTERAGSLRREAAEALGLVEGTYVGVGGGDGACATRGALAYGSFDAYLYLGSSSWISMIADRPLIDPTMRIQNYYDLGGESCDVTGTVQSASIAADWALDTLCDGEAGGDFARLEAEASSVPPGSGGLLFLPYLMGERTPHWDADARGAFLGLSLSTTKADMLRAVLEGVAYALGDVTSVYSELGIPIESLVLLGGGARSELWRRILCDALGLPVSLHPTPVGATSLGAALAAGMGVGLYPSLAPGLEAGGMTAMSPDGARAAAYARSRAAFDAAYPALKSVSATLASIARDV